LTTNGAWVGGTFYDGFPLTAADMNANNQWLLSEANSTVLLNNANTWLAAQTFDILVTAPTTVAGLPATPTNGQRGFVIDAMALTFGSAVAGAGTLRGPVYYDASVPAWKAG
jgi:hypothetical protein